jgi:hypothetical protein
MANNIALSLQRSGLDFRPENWNCDKVFVVAFSYCKQDVARRSIRQLLPIPIIMTFGNS